MSSSSRSVRPWEDAPARGTAPCIDRIWRRAWERQADLAQERERARALYSELHDQPPGRQLLQIANRPRFWSWGLCELILEECWEARFDDATRMLALADVAVAIAQRLDVTYYGHEKLQDLTAQAWAYRGNALKIKSDYANAEAAIQIAETRLTAGTGDPIERARILELKAALRSAQNRCREALRLFDEIITIYRRIGDSHLLGTALAQKGLVCGQLGENQDAIRLTRKSLELMAPERDLARTLAARHNLVSYLHESGQLEEALDGLREIRPLYAQLGHQLNLLRLRWLEGQIAATLGQPERAEAAFLEVRNGFVAQGIGLDAAEVSMELAALYVRQRRFAELRCLATEMLPIFQSRDLQQQAAAALMLFQKAVAIESVSTQLVREIRARLENTRHRPPMPSPLPTGSSFFESAPIS